MVFSYVLVKGWIIDSYVYSFFTAVSSLSFLSEVVEKCILEHSTHTVLNLICYQTSSLHIDKITEQKLVCYKIVNDLLWGMERKLVTAVAILDLSTAIDTVDH